MKHNTEISYKTGVKSPACNFAEGEEGDKRGDEAYWQITR